MRTEGLCLVPDSDEAPVCSAPLNCRRRPGPRRKEAPVCAPSAAVQNPQSSSHTCVDLEGRLSNATPRQFGFAVTAFSGKQ